MPDRKLKLAIEHPNQRGTYLMIGVPDGKVRPALWLQRGMNKTILASFHGEKHMQAFETFISDLIETINEIHDDDEKQNDGPVDKP